MKGFEELNEQEIQRIAEQAVFEQLPDTLSAREKQEAESYQQLFDALESSPANDLSADFTDKVMLSVARYDRKKAWKEYFGLFLIISLTAGLGIGILYFMGALRLSNLQTPFEPLVRLVNQYTVHVLLLSIIVITGKYIDRLIPLKKARRV